MLRTEAVHSLSPPPQVSPHAHLVKPTLAPYVYPVSPATHLAASPLAMSIGFFPVLSLPPRRTPRPDRHLRHSTCRGGVGGSKAV